MLRQPELHLENFDCEAVRLRQKRSFVKHSPHMPASVTTASSTARPLKVPSIVVDLPNEPKPHSFSHSMEQSSTKMRLPRSQTHRRHSFAPPSMLDLSHAAQLRKIGHRRHSGVMEDPFGRLAEHVASPNDPHVTKWLTHSWVFNQRKKAAFLRGLLLGVLAAIFTKIWMRFVWTGSPNR